MMKYVTRIRGKLNISATKKTSNLFDGSYKSVYTGNGFDFENLREYIPGDNIRDIDWKASARGKNVLVKNYIAERKHNVLLVFDGGKNMSAHSPALQVKKEVALYSGGTMGYLAVRNGDQIGAICTRDGKVEYEPVRSGLHQLERILTNYDAKELAKGNSKADMDKSLEYIIKNISRRMIVVIITDMAGVYGLKEETIKKLSYKNDILVICIADASLTGEKSYHVGNVSYVPDFFIKNKKLKKLEKETRKQIFAENEKKLMKHRIAMTEVEGDKDLAKKIEELLERHKYAGVR